MAQPGISRNAFFVEGLGQGAFYSLNYERSWYLEERLRLGARVGIAPWEETVNLPLSVQLLYGRASHRAETGIGLSYHFLSQISSGPVFKPQWIKAEKPFWSVYLGYRYQAPRGGLVFRAGYVPFLDGMAENSGVIRQGFVHWLGISLGYALPYQRKRNAFHDD